MSTRCNILIHDPEVEGSPDLPVILYHHQDSMSDRFLPKLHRLLKDAHEFLKQADRDCWWNSERLAAIMILLSADASRHAAFAGLLPTDPEDVDTAPEAAVPTLLPCAAVHRDIEYIYDVWLSPVSGCYRIDHAPWDENS